VIAAFWSGTVCPLHRIPSPEADGSEVTKPVAGNIMADNDVGSEDAQSLLFRFGFICFAAADGPRNNDETWAAIRRSWPKIQLGEFIIHRHPETRLSHQSHGDKHTVLIGDAFMVGEGDPLALAAGAVGDELLDLLDRLSGRFALLIMQGGAGKVFHDAFGARSIFYTLNGAIALASHSRLLACAFGAKPILDTPVATQLWLPGDMTIFRDVYALPPNHCYDIAARKVIRYWPRKSRRKTSFDEFFCALDNYLKALIGFVRPPRHPILSLTGGIDSRLIAAAFHHYGAEFSTVTFTSFHFKAWEAAPVAEMSRYLGVPHSEINESNDSINAAALIGARNGGRYNGQRPAVVAGMYRLYRGSLGAIFVPGLGAEVIRGFYNLKLNPMRDRSATEMLRVFLEVMGDETPTLDPRVESVLLSAFEGFRERAGYDRFDGHGFDVNDIFYWEHRVGMWESEGLNEIDAAVPSLIGFNSRTVCEAAYGLSDDERLSKELFVEVIKRYDAHIAAVPFWPTEN
jgi:hypothetical protein